MFGWDRYVFNKNCTGRRYGELVFLHTVGFAGHVVHFGAPLMRNIDTLFIKFLWDTYGFNKKHIGTRYAELVFLPQVGSVGHVVHFGTSGA
jgi:hypothetical protein